MSGFSLYYPTPSLRENAPNRSASLSGLAGFCGIIAERKGKELARGIQSGEIPSASRTLSNLPTSEIARSHKARVVCSFHISSFCIHAIRLCRSTNHRPKHLHQAMAGPLRSALPSSTSVVVAPLALPQIRSSALPLVTARRPGPGRQAL